MEGLLFSVCLEKMLNREIFQYAPISVVSLVILLVVAFFFGPKDYGNILPALF